MKALHTFSEILGRAIISPEKLTCLQLTTPEESFYLVTINILYVFLEKTDL